MLRMPNKLPGDISKVPLKIHIEGVNSGAFITNYKCNSFFLSPPAKNRAKNEISGVIDNELQEKHLQDALDKQQSFQNTSIPVPDVIEIDEEVYDKMYPATVELPKSRVFTFPECSKSVEYDIDSADKCWIDKRNIQVDRFEKAIEILEEIFAKRIPSIEDLKKSKVLTGSEIEAIYDYWLDKCLSEKSRLTFRLKTENNQRFLKSINDPYVAFRKCPEKISTRKNRAQDRSNYMKLLEKRSQLFSCLSSWKYYAILARERKCFIQAQMELFREQYQNKSFSVEFLSNKFTASPMQRYEEDHPVESPDTAKSQDDIEESFSFERRSNCEYYKPINKLHDDLEYDEPQKKFKLTTRGFLRPRIGRGGRVIYDRRTLSDQSALKPEYQEVNINPEVRCKRLAKPFALRAAGTSSFTLHNISNVIMNDTSLELKIFD